MNSTATTNIDGVAPVTALDLVNIAGVLIDSADIDDNPSESTRTFRTGVKAGIVSMCKAATSAINAFGASSLAQQAGPAPAEQHGDAQSNQAVTPQSDGPEQHPGAAQQAGIILSDRQHASLILGEKRAGSIIDLATGIIYDVMLMPGELSCVTWSEAKAEIRAAGGDLPTRDEMLLLNKLLGSLAFRDDQYWTDEKVTFIGEPGEAISYFSDGYFEITNADDRMHARGVRRISVGDVAHEGADPIDDSYVVVPAPAIPAKAGTSADEAAATLQRLDGYMAASGYDTDHPWRREIASASASGLDLSDRLDLQAMRAALFAPAPPLTVEAVATVLGELVGIIEADDDDHLAAGVCKRVIDVINGLMLIADPEKLV